MEYTELLQGIQKIQR